MINSRLTSRLGVLFGLLVAGGFLMPIGFSTVFSATSDGSVKRTVFLGAGQNGMPDFGNITRFGVDLENIGDFNGDGVTDLAVGIQSSYTFDDLANSTFNEFFFILLMNQDGTVSETIKVEESHEEGEMFHALQMYGHGIASLGDFDGDGVIDFAVGAPDYDTGPFGSAQDDKGALFITLMNANGTVKSVTEIKDDLNGIPTLSDRDRFGTAVTNIGDIDGDGNTDIAVSAVSDSDPDEGSIEASTGKIYILLLNGDGSIKSSVEISNASNNLGLSTEDLLGTSMDRLGDYDGDGVPDLLVGAGGDNDSRGAFLILYLNDDGTLKSFRKYTASDLPGAPVGGALGQGLAQIGDLDENGTADFAVSLGIVDGETVSGIYLVLLMNPDGSVKSTTSVPDGTNGFAELPAFNFLGLALTGMGDLDGDGVLDLAVSDSFFFNGTTTQGSAYIVFNAEADTGGGGEGSETATPSPTASPTPSPTPVPTVEILSGAVSETVKIADSTGGMTTLADSDSFGSSVTNIGDLNGDGVEDMVVGASGDDT
ncbi:MAG: hypothetical protein AAF633_01370, partial [Chloroflexota bacterium]